MGNKLRQSGNVMFALMGAIAVAGILSYGVNSYIRGPLKTAVRMTKQNAAESQMRIAGQISVMGATSVATSDCDSDGYTEPLEWRDAGSLPKPTGGGLIPSTVGSNKTDPWGTQYGYCAWDHGSVTLNAGCQTTSPGTNMRLQGANATIYPVVAIISAGPDKTFTTTCRNFSTGSDRADQNNNGVLTDSGDRELVSKAAATDDDVIMTYTYAEATAGSGGLWSLKSGDSTTATIDKNIEALGATFSGASRFSSIEAKTASFLDVVSGLKLAGPGIVTTCDATSKGVLRLSASGTTIEICDGAAFVTAVGAGEAETETSGLDCTGLGDLNYNDPVSGHCYYQVSTATLNWADAQAACEANDGYLANVTSATEETMLEAQGLGSGWVGAKDDVIEGRWTWAVGEYAGVQFWSGGRAAVDGVAVNGQYNKWNPNSGGWEPNGSTSENCMLMEKVLPALTTSIWSDAQCSSARAYLCEKEAPLDAGSFDDLSDAITNYTKNNFFVGIAAGSSSTSGTKNTVLGGYAASKLTTGSENSIMGQEAMYNNLTTGSHNTVVGKGVLYGNNGSYNTALGNFGGDYGGSAVSYSTMLYGNLNAATGSYNIAGGRNAMESGGSGASNIAFGGYSFRGYGTGAFNVFMGTQSGQLSSTQSSAIGIGTSALEVSSDYGSIAIGQRALDSQTSGTANVAVGFGTMTDLTTVGRNTAIGYYVLGKNTGTSNVGLAAYALLNNTGNYNVGIGYDALDDNTGGANNTALGYQTLDVNIGASNNTGIGYNVLTVNTTGANNTAIGYNSMQFNVSYADNTVIGGLENNTPSGSYAQTTAINSMSNHRSGASNIGIGKGSLGSETQASFNVAVGASALSTAAVNITKNTAVGFEALKVMSTTTGANTAIGRGASLANTSGNNNTAVGMYALRYNTTGGNNTAIGYDAGPASGNTGLSNTTSIGYMAQVTTSNDVRVGDANITVISAAVSYAASSDRRIKKDITPSDLGLDFLMSLKPVSYRLKDGNGRLDYGFIAQDIEKSLDGRIANMITRSNDEMKTYNLRSADLMAPMVKSIQQQDKIIRDLKAQIAAIKEKHCQKGNVR